MQAACGEEKDAVCGPGVERILRRGHGIWIAGRRGDQWNPGACKAARELVSLCPRARKARGWVTDPVEAVKPGGHDNSEGRRAFLSPSQDAGDDRVGVGAPVGDDEFAVVGLHGHGAFAGSVVLRSALIGSEMPT